MSNDEIKAAVAALVLAAFNLAAVLGLHLSQGALVWTTTGLVLVASMFAPRIRYLGTKYAGAIGAALAGALGFLNWLTTNVWEPSNGVIAAITTVLVAFGALFVPSLVRPKES